MVHFKRKNRTQKIYLLARSIRAKIERRKDEQEQVILAQGCTHGIPLKRKPPERKDNN